jgi:diaminopimelate epimerase
MIKFSKMQGLGNDFMVIDNTRGDISLSKEKIQQLAHRHFGVGFDQLLLVESSKTVDFRYRIFNADGSEVEQCGNGARCFARFVFDKGLSDKNPLLVETRSGIISLLLKEKKVCVDMGQADFKPSSIGLSDASALFEAFDYTMGSVSMGNPHIVLIVKNIDLEIIKIAKKIQTSSLLTNSANIGFMQIVNPGKVHLRVYERGSGETLACGSGACAAVAFGVQQGLLGDCVQVNLKGGVAQIEHKDKKLFLTGPAEFVFEGFFS